MYFSELAQPTRKKCFGLHLTTNSMPVVWVWKLGVTQFLGGIDEVHIHLSAELALVSPAGHNREMLPLGTRFLLIWYSFARRYLSEVLNFIKLHNLSNSQTFSYCTVTRKPNFDACQIFPSHSSVFPPTIHFFTLFDIKWECLCYLTWEKNHTESYF